MASQLPPCSAARSTTTEPGFIKSTISLGQSFGAGIPGISAVVITISISGACSLNSSISFFMNSLEAGFAYPPSPLPSESKSSIKNSAPIDSICSDTSGLTSNALTIAPIDCAVPIAANPATPAPITRILAGGTFPAAVIWPVKNLPN